MREVAALARVSIKTVSRVVNGERNVRETTRETVLAAVKDLRYAPNPAARSLAGAQSARIGLLYSNPSAAYLSEFLLGALDESTRKSAQLMLEKCEVSSAAGERAAGRRLLEGGVAGVILPPPVCESHVILTELRKAGIPTVAVATGRFRADASCVRIDDYKAASEMTRYLLTLGHRRIGFVKGHPNQTASGERLLGFEAALREADCKTEPPSIEQGFFSYRSGLEAAEKLLALSESPAPIVGYLGKLIPQKGVELLLAAHRDVIDLVGHDLELHAAMRRARRRIGGRPEGRWTAGLETEAIALGCAAALRP